jgi:hypothetical protein
MDNKVFIWVGAIFGIIAGVWVLYWAYEKITGSRKEQHRQQDEALQLCDSIKKRLDGSLGRAEPLCNAKRNDINNLLQSIEEKLKSAQK